MKRHRQLAPQVLPALSSQEERTVQYARETWCLVCNGADPSKGTGSWLQGAMRVPWLLAAGEWVRLPGDWGWVPSFPDWDCERDARWAAYRAELDEPQRWLTTPPPHGALEHYALPRPSPASLSPSPSRDEAAWGAYAAARTPGCLLGQVTVRLVLLALCARDEGGFFGEACTAEDVQTWRDDVHAGVRAVSLSVLLGGG